jgi:hypothetical protein
MKQVMKQIIWMEIVVMVLMVGPSATTVSAGILMPKGIDAAHLDADGVNYDSTNKRTNSLASAHRTCTSWFSWVPSRIS